MPYLLNLQQLLPLLATMKLCRPCNHHHRHHHERSPSSVPIVICVMVVEGTDKSGNDLGTPFERQLFWTIASLWYRFTTLYTQRVFFFTLLSLRLSGDSIRLAFLLLSEQDQWGDRGCIRLVAHQGLPSLSQVNREWWVLCTEWTRVGRDSLWTRFQIWPTRILILLQQYDRSN